MVRHYALPDFAETAQCALCLRVIDFSGSLAYLEIARTGRCRVVCVECVDAHEAARACERGRAQ